MRAPLFLAVATCLSTPHLHASPTPQPQAATPAGQTSDASLGAIPKPTAPNMVLVIADDVGVYELASYGEGTDPANTPTIDGLAASGVSFTNCWSNPLCTPTRATIHTGRYALQTGVGSLLTAAYGMAQGELTLPDVLHIAPTPYRNGFFGKWHLTNDAGGGMFGPNNNGYDHAIWTKHNLIPPDETYTRWTQIENGVEVDKIGYITTETVDRALEFVQSVPEPWLVVLSFHAAHDPFHKPPAGLYTSDVSAAGPGNSRPLFKAMIEALDHELGRFLAETNAQAFNTEVIFVGDNGSPTGVIGPPGTNDKAKGTVWEGGINVPLIISGPSVTAPGTVSDALVNTTDLFATMAEMGGIPIPPTVYQALKLNSISLLPYLSKPSLGTIRKVAYAEWFTPAGYSMTEYMGALRDRRFKLIIEAPPIQLRFYDLFTDEFEQVNLLQAPLTPEAQLAFDKLNQDFVAKLATYGP